VILPPWYRTFWAYAGYFTIILLLILIFRHLIVIRTQLKHELLLQLVEKDKLDQVNKMKTRFFTNISHEFRTPLTLIIGPLESLLSDINLKPAINRQLNSIQKNARRLLRLINQLLDISEIEADHLKLKVRKGDVVVFIKEIASLFRWLAGQKKIDYTIISNVNNFIGYFDSDKIEKICYNLIANAFKFTAPEGRVTFNIEVIGQANTKYSGYIKIQINDSGIGINEADKEKIFEHFYRTEKSETLSKDGSGIGLALVRGLVNVYRGEIDLKSIEGKGTEFTLYLPVDKTLFKSAEINELPIGEIPPTIDIYDLEQGFTEAGFTDNKRELLKDADESSPLILLVEDHQELRIHMAEQFSVSYRILEAANGKEALTQSLEYIPDLIISDIRMPVMDGIELCSQLKKDEKTSHIPIILLTAKVSDEDRLKGLNTGADAYITKPFESKVLIATVKNLIESRRKLKEKYSRSLLIEPDGITITSVDEKFLKRAIAIVEKNISNPDYSVETYSKDIGMSRSHLHRKFVGLTGHSPSAFIRTLRMKRAAQLLTKGQLTVSEILFEVGIKSRSYFTKSFKEQFGDSPTDFAMKNKSPFRNNFNFET
jgi:signal transduction histidine kinase/CheY-like chemotaxis protein/AraC-like DNA-binding protein